MKEIKSSKPNKSAKTIQEETIGKLIYASMHEKDLLQNEYLDFPKVISQKEVKMLVERLKQRGVEYITVSSKSSVMLEDTKQLYTKLGCEPVDVILVNVVDQEYTNLALKIKL